ncbi:MAG: SRPBCC family protein [Angustibacter sp.]
MAKLTRSITVHAPVESVFGFALDIGRLWRAKDVALGEITLTPDGVGTSARIFTHALGFHIEGGIEYTEVVPNERIVAQVHFFAEKPKWTFTFAPTKSGTKVTAVGEWAVPMPVVGKPIESMMVREHEPFLEGMLANLKSQVESMALA